MPLLSVVVPMYNESAAADAFFEATVPVLESITDDWEIIAIDDGSKDDTFARLGDWHAKDSRIRAIKFSRNFGKEQALTAGIDHAAGKAVVLLDADLQDPPSLIPQMMEKWHEGYQVVVGQRISRTGEPRWKRYTASLFYWVINRISTVPVIPNTGDFRLMDEEAVAAMRRLRERNRFMRGLLAWSGMKQCILPFDRPPRLQGTTKFSFLKSLLYALDGIISLSNAPLRLPTFLGALVCPLSLLSMLVSSGQVFWVSLLFLLVGTQFLCLGMLGEYLARVYKETRDQPLYYVGEVLGPVERASMHGATASRLRGVSTPAKAAAPQE